MKKVGRNDPCPCGSGNKYKKCCLGKLTQPTSLPWPTFPEEVVIEELLKSSEEFKAFYQSERDKITEPIYWAHDSSMPVGIYCRTTRIHMGNQVTRVIRLRRVPAHLEDAKNVAHELEHIVLDSEGFPCTGVSDRTIEVISSSLNSMVHDPIVDSRLQPYGFDLRRSYEAEVEEDIRQLNMQSNSPLAHLDRMHWIFNYVGKILDWEMVSIKDDTNISSFQSWYDARYPDVAAEGQELLDLVKSVGFDTPEKMSTLFGDIIRRYKLGEVLFLQVV